MKSGKYILPETIRTISDFYESTDCFLKINAHTRRLDKGQAVLTQNLFTFVLEGHKEILHAEGKLVLQKNEGVLLKKGAYVVSERFESEKVGFKNILLFFDDALLQEIPLKKCCEPFKNTSFLQKISANEVLTNIISTLEKYSTQDFFRKNFAAILRLKTTEILTLSQHLNPAVLHFLHSISEEKNSQLLPVFEQYFKENLQLQDYAHLTNRSLSALKRQFKNKTGKSPIKWITERRLQEAQQQLVHHNLSISDIAYGLGFESLSHFSRIFKERYGKSPTQYRAELLR